MKSLLVGIISAILMLSLVTTAVAAETIIKQNGSKQMDVQAKAVYISPENIYTDVVINGNASITTQSGTTISILTNVTTLDGMTLNVTEIVSTDEEAYSWMSNNMNGLCDKFTAYDIYFTDNGGNRIAVSDDVTVSITTPEGYANIQVFSISSDSTKTKVESEQSGKNTVFTAKTFNYFVLADNASDSGTTPLTPEDSEPPQTGDTNNVAIYLVLFLLSVGAVIALGFIVERKKNAGKNESC